jgi:hypothetical protein
MNSSTHIFEQAINSEWYVSDILQLFFESIMEIEKTLFYTRWYYSTNANYSINVLNRVLEDR